MAWPSIESAAIEGTNASFVVAHWDIQLVRIAVALRSLVANIATETFRVTLSLRHGI